MIAIPVLIDIPSLPSEGTFDSQVDGATTFFISGSVSSSKDNTIVGIQFYVDDVLWGTGQIYCTKANYHQTFIPLLLGGDITIGPHTAKAVAMNEETLFNGVNDYLYIAQMI
jgi:hypothetical protein